MLFVPHLWQDIKTSFFFFIQIYLLSKWSSPTWSLHWHLFSQACYKMVRCNMFVWYAMEGLHNPLTLYFPWVAESSRQVRRIEKKLVEKKSWSNTKFSKLKSWVFYGRQSGELLTRSWELKGWALRVISTFSLFFTISSQNRTFRLRE